ncbi:MAG TPA: YcgN family cysteine cluster protein [Sphingorhabdus sp.]|uniref:YcgN family cysteine cluster protein n=1 Tax=Sphingorhabdus sp. TaxID=1902408 RepID=UPI002D0B553D|nr:YcgN family cysteine cluster protein [Sphingorhabdus sp.]HMT41884.1 YcgN family cysteine cluster protein [Sphingorhabdus sp.]HMU23166.1 YcgN family cysteine cluster protein [Sphingorhabdus sp.]
MSEVPFWEQPIEALTRDQWEALCDGCGKCCLHKVEDEDTGRIYATNVACKLLDLSSCRCADYRHRRMHVPDCIRLTRRSIDNYPWLPSTCAYVLRANGQPLPDWHYLVCGDQEAVHRAGISVKGRAISELHAGPLENHIVEQPL